MFILLMLTACTNVLDNKNLNLGENVAVKGTKSELEDMELIDAVYRRDKEKVIKLLSKPDVASFINNENRYGENALNVCVSKCTEFNDGAGLKAGNYDILKALIRKGVDMNHRDCDGMTPLMRAASLSDKRGLMILISAGADKSIELNGKGAFHIAMDTIGEDSLLRTTFYDMLQTGESMISVYDNGNFHKVRIESDFMQY